MITLVQKNEIDINSGKIVKNIRKNIKDYFTKYPNIKSVVLGMSGGIDSAVTALLFKPVCDEMRVKLIGYTLPIETNHPDETKRAEMVGDVCDYFDNVDLTEMYMKMKPYLIGEMDRPMMPAIKNRIRAGNIKARTRMIFLYDKAYYNQGMVLSTDNYTELLLGFWTLHGDVGDYGVIQGLWKTEVYNVARYILNMETQNYLPKVAEGLQQTIDANPTDGLGVASGDLEQIGVKTYEDVDKILIDYVNGKSVIGAEALGVIQRSVNSEFKRNNPFNIAREDLLK
jgi:nicotinamide-nucleotide amidase